MIPEDKLKTLINQSQVRTSSQTDERILADAVDRMEKLIPQSSSGTGWNLWRIIMKSPLTKIAIAAVIIIACAIGLSLWRTTGSGIALADVLARMEQVKAYGFKCSVKINNYEEYSVKIKNYEERSTVLISQEYGSKTTYEFLDPNGGQSKFQETYFLPQKKIRIEIAPNKKKYSRIELDDMNVQRQQEREKQDNSLSHLRRMLTKKYESLGRSTIDGIEVAGFRTTDPNSLEEVKLWVDVKTRLPVRYEYEHFQQMGDNKKGYIRIVFYDFQWDVPVDASEFEPPPIPDGYTFTEIKLPPNNEETAIQGLKQCVELFGKYPERILDIYQRVKAVLSGKKYVTPLPALPAERLQEAIKGLTEDQINNKLLMPIRGLERFGHRLEWEKKESAYYGKTVTPKDADKVLMRWKVSDNEYRVIFGDLHAETVTSEKLAELEKLISK